MNTPSVPVSHGTPLTRRKFMQALLGFSIVTTMAGIVTPIVAFVWPQRRPTSYAGPIDVGKVEDFPPNSGTIVAIDNKPIIIVNTKAGGLKAYSAICTHLAASSFGTKQKVSCTRRVTTVCSAL